MSIRKLFFATDVHGSQRCYAKFVNAAKHYGADTLILGGDVCGKLIIPVVAAGGGKHRAVYHGDQVEVEGAAGLEKLLSDLRFSGYYPFVTTPEALDEISSDGAARDRLFMKLMADTLGRWVSLAEERLRGTGTRLFMMLGNDDEPELAKCLEGSDVVVSAEGNVWDLGDGITMASYGYSNRTPWHAPRELDEDDLYARIEAMAVRIPAGGHSIFNLHVPPIGSGLDVAPMIDDRLEPVVDLQGYVMTQAGSTAVRKAIETFQPLIGLHGHIHESRGNAKIGRTNCFNPGSEYGEGILKGVVLLIDTKKGLRDYMFTTG